MIFKTLPHSDSHPSLFFKYMQPGEKIGLATVDKDLLCYDTIHNLKSEINNFLSYGIHSNLNWNTVDIHTKLYKDSYKVPIENYCKLAWLTHDYIKNKSFKHPVGIHWDMQSKKWIIHPGGSRQKIIHLFHQGPLKVLAFNTGGVKLLFDKTFLDYDDMKQYFNCPEMYLCLVADQGSLIPHIHFNKERTIINSVHGYYIKLKKFFTKTKLVANFDLTEFGYTVPKTYKNTINITIEDSTSLKQQIRALCLVPNFDTFNKHGVKIERT
tara:strand:- start:47 stop:850 length:804 start_codon:yes stop_codon:yes gene_type:complete